MSDIEVLALGAGREVGRSCIVVRLGGYNVMFDCGIHMGYSDAQRFPDFASLPYTIDLLLISHFHLDHCGALPVFTERFGYTGPIYMTAPCKSLCPLLIDDYRRVSLNEHGEEPYTQNMLYAALSKVSTVNRNETISVKDGLVFTCYYAGHVLGAAMFFVNARGRTVLYTGDYNTMGDRHLAGAALPAIRPDVLITETTYATTIREPRKERELEFLNTVMKTVNGGGKVLIPVFAIGRAQELCLLLDSYWETIQTKTPLYFHANMTEKATKYYKTYVDWTNENVKHESYKRNVFEWRHIRQFEKNTKIDEPMVVLASPGMLHSGASLDLFKRWARDERNAVIFPGYCVAGTIGNKLLSGQREFDFPDGKVEVKLNVMSFSFSAHADSQGIMQLLEQSCPRAVVLVHGEYSKMEAFKKRVEEELRIRCEHPENGMILRIDVGREIELYGESLEAPCVANIKRRGGKLMCTSTQELFHEVEEE